MTTEVEANSLICGEMSKPVVRLNGEAGLFRVQCYASLCGHWRWAEPSTEIKDLAREEDVPEGEGWVKQPGTINKHYRWSRRNPDRHGFCGLAGAQGAPIS